MAEDFRDELHSVQQSLAVLSKTLEGLQYEMRQGFIDMKNLIQGLDNRLISTEHRLQQQIVQLENRTRQDIGELRTTAKHQMWTMVGAVVFAVLAIAYSTAKLPPIPRESCHPFHAKAATHST
jgi:hypothetical protein